MGFNFYFVHCGQTKAYVTEGTRVHSAAACSSGARTPRLLCRSCSVVLTCRKTPAVCVVVDPLLLNRSVALSSLGGHGHIFNHKPDLTNPFVVSKKKKWGVRATYTPNPWILREGP